jgi:acyl-coenzyme A thioesterase PaaI-like protein
LTSETTAVPASGALGFEVAPHACFACGTRNPSGIGLTIHVEAGRSWAEIALPSRFQGWDEIAHGGIVATLLDEVMAWSLVGGDDWGVTARMQLEFRRPVPLEHPVRAEGWITATRRRLVDTAATLTDAETGLLLARATGTYVAADADRKQQLRERYGWRPVATPTALETAR